MTIRHRDSGRTFEVALCLQGRAVWLGPPGPGGVLRLVECDGLAGWELVGCSPQEHRVLLVLSSDLRWAAWLMACGFRARIVDDEAADPGHPHDEGGRYG